jgi:hypothetical protein
MPVLNPDHLLEQADRLATPLASGGAPRQADLRRAISNAYYSVFHALLTDAVDHFVGRTRRQTPIYGLVYRSIEHRSIPRLCEDIMKPRLPDKYSKYEPAGGFGPDLTAVATAVVDLQEKRHLADYDPLFRVDLSDAVLAVATSRSALLRLRNANRSRRNIFLALLVFAPR